MSCTDDTNRLKAFRVIRSGFPAAIYFAETASKAKISSLIAGRDAGYSISFSDLSVKRAPEFDGATYCGEVPRVGCLPQYLEKRK